MEDTGGEHVRSVSWAEGDFSLLERNNSPETTGHLGGPEPAAKLTERHRRYPELESGRMYRIVPAGSGGTVGSIGYRERTWRGEPVWETGWGAARVPGAGTGPAGGPRGRRGRPAGHAGHW
ncbi:hypothetical protein ACIRPQ_31945 [Streptomyces sp. NPDC101213]|uniref:hypothetical protein n=1 Tax=Streptomyces sp. NPDC101213 TaxID=3366130 RepID=UPI0038110554